MGNIDIMDREESLRSDLVTAALVFLLGKEILTLSTLILLFIEKVILGDPTGPTEKYVLEFGLLAYAIGIFSVILIRAYQKL